MCSPASRHTDLFHTDWLQILQRTRSNSSEHVYLNGTIQTAVRSGPKEPGIKWGFRSLTGMGTFEGGHELSIE